MRLPYFLAFAKSGSYLCCVLLGLTIVQAFPPDLVFQNSVSPFDFRLWTMSGALQESDQAFSPGQHREQPMENRGNLLNQR